MRTFFWFPNEKIILQYDWLDLKLRIKYNDIHYQNDINFKVLE